MTVEQLRKIVNTRPFTPFTLKLANGTRLRVVSPEFFVFFPSGRTVFVATGDESYEIVDLLLVTALEVGGGERQSRAGWNRKRCRPQAFTAHQRLPATRLGDPS